MRIQDLAGLGKGAIVPSIEIYITGRCNFDCSFCSAKGIPKKDMNFSDFKRIIDGLAEVSEYLGVHPGVCIGGGEPFLHPDFFKMVGYAAEKLSGRARLSVTTNGSFFSLNEQKTRQVLERLRGLRLNLSVDREHLRQGRNSEAVIMQVLRQALALGIPVEAITVARTAREQRKPLPRKLEKAVLASVSKRNVFLRRDFLSNKKTVSSFKKGLKEIAEGRQFPLSLALIKHYYSNFNSFPRSFNEVFGKLTPKAKTHVLSLSIQSLGFLPDGKASIMGNSTFRIPQLGVGNWRRESIGEILINNYQFKERMVSGWAGGGAKPDAKQRLLAKAVLNKIKISEANSKKFRRSAIKPK